MNGIDQFIESMKLKSAVVGGFDKESVYTFIQELYSKGQEEILGLQKERDMAEESYAKTSRELEQARKDIQTLQIRLEEEQKFRMEYNRSFDTLSLAIESVNLSRGKILEDSKAAAEAMISEASDNLERLKRDCLQHQQTRDAIVLEIAGARQKFNASLETLQTGLAKILSEVGALREVSFGQESGGGDAGENAESSAKSSPGRQVRLMTGCAGVYEIR